MSDFKVMSGKCSYRFINDNTALEPVLYTLLLVSSSHRGLFDLVKKVDGFRRTKMKPFNLCRNMYWPIRRTILVIVICLVTLKKCLLGVLMDCIIFLLFYLLIKSFWTMFSICSARSGNSWQILKTYVVCGRKLLAHTLKSGCFRSNFWRTNFSVNLYLQVYDIEVFICSASLKISLIGTDIFFYGLMNSLHSFLKS